MSSEEREQKLEGQGENADSSELVSSDSQKVRNPNSLEVRHVQESNPNQFHSVADLKTPQTENVEPFQIMDDSKIIAASRSLEQAGNRSFHDGLKALPEGSTSEQLAQYQIDYMNRKSLETNKPSTLKLYSGISNVPEVTSPIESAEDARRFLSGLSEAIINGAWQMVVHMSEPDAINRDVQASIALLSQDNNEFNRQLIAIGQNVLDRLDKPMKPEETGKEVSQMAAWFIWGNKKPIGEAKVLEQTGLSASEIRLIDAETRWSKYGIDWAERYREIFFLERPELAAIAKQLEVHHRIPQAVLDYFPGLFRPSEIHGMKNLRAIEKSTGVHAKITKSWDTFFRPYKIEGRIPTKEDIFRKAKQIDELYGKDLIE